MDKRPKPLEPDHPEMNVGDLLGSLEEDPGDLADLAKGGGEDGPGDLVPDGYASLD